MTVKSESRAVVDAWLEAFRSKDVSSLRLAADFVHSSPFGEVRGRKAYLDLVAENAEAFFSKKLETLDVLDCGDKFAVRYLVDGAPACDCIYLRDGEIARIYSYYHFGEKPSL